MIHAPAIQNDRKRGPLAAAHRVVPGFTRVHLAQMFASHGFTYGAEVGVADGRYSLTLLQTIPNLRLVCVDPWEPYRGNTRGGPREQHERNYRLAQERLVPYGAMLVRSKSMDAIRLVAPESLDFVYLDANHSYRYIRNDIAEWSTRVRRSGVIAGHDFYEFRDGGVVEAVTEFTQENGITDWAITDEREPSFWWAKR